MKKLQPTPVGLLLGAGAGALAALLGLTPLFQRFEAKLYDGLVSGFADPELGRTSRVKLLLYTEADFNAYQKEDKTLVYPPPRDFWGELVQAVSDFGVKPGAIAIDLLFVGPGKVMRDGKGEDQLLADLLRAHSHVTLAFIAESPGEPPAEPLPPPYTIAVYGDSSGAPALGRTLLAEPALQDAVTRFGNARIEIDRGDLVRTLPIVGRVGEQYVPSLALATAMTLLGESSINLWPDALKGFGNVDVPLDGDGRLLVNFRGARGTYPTVSVTELFQAEPTANAKAWRESLKDGDVIVIGANVIGAPDVVSTPVDDSLPGPELQATAIDNLIRGDARRRVPAWAGFAIAVLLGAIVGVTAVRASRKRSALFIVAPVVLAFFGAVLLAFRSGLVIDAVAPLTGAVLSYTGSALYLFNTEGKKRREIRQSFSRYLAPEVVKQLEDHPDHLRLGGERRAMTIQFSDLAGFTSFSEKMKAEDLVTFLNEYLTAMTDIILDHKGVIDKYLGDAIMAFWGAPLPRPDHARVALAAVAHCQQRLARFVAEKSALGLPNLVARTGINTGEVVVGNMGSSRRFDYTVMGDSVNLASRLEGANKFFDSVVMVTDATLAAAGEGAAIVRPLGKLRVKGKNEPVGVHELLGAGGALETSLPAWAATFAEGLALFQRGEFAAATKVFEQSHAARPGGDPVSVRFIKLCEEYAAKHPKGGFDGIITLTEK